MVVVSCKHILSILLRKGKKILNLNFKIKKITAVRDLDLNK